MSALCETGARPGYFDRFTAAGTAWYIPEEGENIFIDSPAASRHYQRITNLYNYDKMTLKNAETKGVKAWRDRRVGYWLCIDPKTGEYYLLTSAALVELNGLKAMYRLPAVYYRIVLTRDWNVKLGPHVIGTHLDTSAYIEDLDGFFARIEAKNKVELRKAIKKRLSL